MEEPRTINKTMGKILLILTVAIIRLDVDNGSPYAIPPDNPFADGVAGLPEIYAWGFRNPMALEF